MANFPKSYGQLDIMRYPNAKYLNVTLPGDTRPTPCVVLPVSPMWMSVNTDRNGIPHAEICVGIEDASLLNAYIAEQDRKRGYQHVNFHGIFHLNPRTDGYKEWKRRIVDSLRGADAETLNEDAKSVHLDRDSIASNPYYRSHPEAVPTLDVVIDRIAARRISRATQAGRVYAPELDNAMPLPGSVCVTSTEI